MGWKKVRKESTRKAQKVTDEEDDGSMVRNNLEITKKTCIHPESRSGSGASPLLRRGTCAVPERFELTWQSAADCVFFHLLTVSKAKDAARGEGGRQRGEETDLPSAVLRCRPAVCLLCQVARR